MNAKRLSLALILALFISGMFTFWLSKKIAKKDPSPPVTKKLYVAAAKALDAGQPLRPVDLELIEWPAAVPLGGSLTKIDDALGRDVLYPLAKGEPILERHLTSAGAGVGLTANIPAGMRAVSVRSDEVVGVAGFIFPGAHVDLILTYRGEKDATMQTSTVLQDVIVIAAGQQTHPDPENKPATVNVVTLLLNPLDAERVVLATSLGTIHFVLRNSTDRGHATSPAMGLMQLVGASEKSHFRGEPTKRQSSPMARQHQVETILGDKHTVSSFD